MARHVICIILLSPIAACAHQPPSDFAADPGLIAQIRQIQIIPAASRACPGGEIHTDYAAILADGSRVPFARTYDNKQPPRLHVRFLALTSPDAVAKANGDWDANDDPLATMSAGFRLRATLQANPSIAASVVLPPTYDCLQRRFSFSGSSGGFATNGGSGPDVTVRLDLQHSPFYQKLYVAGIEVNGARPFYVLADSSTIGSAQWLSIVSRGGDGGNGFPGSDGLDGTPGAPGCPGQQGGQGHDGSDGGAGGDGGNGGRITVVVPPDRQHLAAVVNTASWGGNGGSGGSGGHGGRGGIGGAGLFDANNQPCSKGADGWAGHDGLQGRSGFPGSSGARVTVASAAN